MNALLLIHVAWLGLGQSPALMEGDLVFQRSTSRQSTAIQLATGSDITHTGVVTMIRGEPHVLEAISRGVSLTPLKRWVARDAKKRYWAKRLADRDRHLTAETLARMKRVGLSFKGRPYDGRFQWDKRRLYCSELVHDIYLVGAGLSLGRVQQVGDLQLDHDLVQQLVRERMTQGLDTSELIITPIAIFDDPRLVTVVAP